MTGFKYPKKTIQKDTFRAAFGIILLTSILLFLNLSFYFQIVFLALLLLFITYAWQGYLNSKLRISFEKDEIEINQLKHFFIKKNKIIFVKLSYFSTKRDKNHNTEDGWMQLTIKTKKRSLKIESSFEGFGELITFAAQAINENSLHCSETTIHNFLSLGEEIGAGEAVNGNST